MSQFGQTKTSHWNYGHGFCSSRWYCVVLSSYNTRIGALGRRNNNNIQIETTKNEVDPISHHSSENRIR